MPRSRLLPLLLALLGLTLAAPAVAAHAPDQPNSHAQWNREIAAFMAQDQARPPPPGSVLFIGSSSIRMWTTLQHDFPEVHTINRGFGGSEINDSTYFADRIVMPYKPRVIVMYAGDNDIEAGDSPGFVRDEFAAFVRKARTTDPGVPIGFIAIKRSMARKNLLPQIRQANALVKAYADSRPGVSYLDVFTPMLGADGQPQWKWFTKDGLHMNRSGYALWVSVVKPWLDATLRHVPRH